MRVMKAIIFSSYRDRSVATDLVKIGIDSDIDIQALIEESREEIAHFYSPPLGDAPLWLRSISSVSRRP